MDKQGAVDVLIRVMNDSSVPHEIRAGAASGLGNIGSHEVRDALARVVTAGDVPYVVRSAAAEALGRAAG
jgi:HEAT repeat protein